MAWSTKTSVVSASSFAGTESFTSGISLNPGEMCHVVIQSCSTTTSGDPTYSFYGSVDSTNFTDVAYFAQNIDNTGGAKSIDVLISGVKSFRIGAQSTGGKHWMTIDMAKDGVNL